MSNLMNQEYGAARLRRPLYITHTTDLPNGHVVYRPFRRQALIGAGDLAVKAERLAAAFAGAAESCWIDREPLRGAVTGDNRLQLETTSQVIAHAVIAAWPADPTWVLPDARNRTLTTNSTTQGETTMSNLLGKPFEDALVYATQLHATQTRKGTDIPYVSHLLAVASLVLEAGGDEDETIAALLHDGPEDQGGLETLAEIRTRFGDRVGDIVAACSDTFEQKKPAWKQRKQAYLDHLLDADDSTRLISCADKLHNARAILTDFRIHGEGLWERFNSGREDILWYYGELARVFSEGGPGRLAAELELVVQALHGEARPEVA